MKQQLKNIILDNQAFEAGTIIRRETLDIPLHSDMIVSLIGARRSGKTYQLYHLIEQLKGEGFSNELIVFINFEDERLNLTIADLDLILQAHQELYPHTESKNVYYFFDEIQNITGWERFVRRLYDTRSKKIFITGSNSKLLSSEIATELRGRTISYTVYPFSFSEFVKAKNGPVNYHKSSDKSKMINLAEEFLVGGGFPELIRFESKVLKTKILQQYFNVMIYRDIIERYSISNPKVLKFFIKKIFSAITVPLSVNKAYNDLKSMGYKISNKYLYEYLDYCNAVFLTQSINRFNFSEIKQSKSDKKTYVIDNGLLAAIDFTLSLNKGKLLENMVAMEFLKKEKEIFYFKDIHECDFIVKENNTLLPVQVAYSIKDDATRVREIRGIQTACKSLNLTNGIIITFDEEEQISTSTSKIEVVPFYKYFSNH